MIRYDVQIVGKQTGNELNREVRDMHFNNISMSYLLDVVEQLEVEGYITYTMVVNRVE